MNSQHTNPTWQAERRRNAVLVSCMVQAERQLCSTKR